jgi:pimeloyl-ACP methyl ester carboxylesterase
MFLAELGVSYVEHNPKAEKALIFLHGLGASKEMWLEQINFFKPLKYRIIAFDFPGFGDSKANNKKVGIKFYANLIDEIAILLKIKSATLIGLSMGGMVLQEFITAKRNLKVQKAVILASIHFFYQQSKFNKARLAIRLFVAKFLPQRIQASLIANILFQNDQHNKKLFIKYFLKSNQTAYQKLLHDMKKIDYRNKLSKINQEILFIAGEKDQIIPIKYQQKISDFVNKIEFIVFQGGHVINIDAGSKVNQAIAEFLDKG